MPYIAQFFGVLQDKGFDKSLRLLKVLIDLGNAASSPLCNSQLVDRVSRGSGYVYQDPRAVEDHRGNFVVDEEVEKS